MKIKTLPLLVFALTPGLYDVCQLSQQIVTDCHEYKKPMPTNYFGMIAQYPQENATPSISQTDLEQTMTQFKKTLKKSQPHIQKLSLSKKEKQHIIVMGDFHGSIHALIRNIQDLQTLGFFDTEYKLAKNTYLVFTGDYADRGRYGIEVWYVAMHLKIQNPNQIFLLRGNHETERCAQYYGFGAELRTKYNQSVEKSMYNLFEPLPLALYVCAGNDCLQFCHGGIPISNKQPFVPVKFLAQNKTDYLEISDQPVIEQFMWNDFAAAKSNEIAKSSRGIGNKINLAHLEELLVKNKQYKNSPITIHNILRGHQHADGALHTLNRQTIFTDGQTIPLSQSPVYTFMSCPEGLGPYCQHEGFGIVTINGSYNNWTLTVRQQRT